MILLIVAYLLNVVDYFFTVYWIQLYGISVEANPIGRWMFENDLAGFIKIVVVGGLFILLGYMIKRRPKAVKVGYLLVGVYGIVVTYHTILALRFA